MTERIKTYVAGVRHKNEDGENIQDLLSAITSQAEKGSSLSAFVLRDTDNKYDENAIAVYLDSTHIGYIPRDLAEELAPRMDGGEDLDVVCASIKEKGDEYFCDLTLGWQNNRDSVTSSQIYQESTKADTYKSPITPPLAQYHTGVVVTNQEVLKDSLGTLGKYELHLDGNTVEVLYAKPQSGGLFQKIGLLNPSAANKASLLMRQGAKLEVLSGSIYKNKDLTYNCEIAILGMGKHENTQDKDERKCSLIILFLCVAAAVILGISVKYMISSETLDETKNLLHNTQRSSDVPPVHMGSSLDTPVSSGDVEVPSQTVIEQIVSPTFGFTTTKYITLFNKAHPKDVSTKPLFKLPYKINAETGVVKDVFTYKFTSSLAMIGVIDKKSRELTSIQLIAKPQTKEQALDFLLAISQVIQSLTPLSAKQCGDVIMQLKVSESFSRKETSKNVVIKGFRYYFSYNNLIGFYFSAEKN